VCCADHEPLTLFTSFHDGRENRVTMNTGPPDEHKAKVLRIRLSEDEQAALDSAAQSEAEENLDMGARWTARFGASA
jgi:hypothetical protein